MKEELIAPCGMICYVCKAHLRKERTCPGCVVEKRGCRFWKCPQLKRNGYRFCFDQDQVDADQAAKTPGKFLGCCDVGQDEAAKGAAAQVVGRRQQPCQECVALVSADLQAQTVPRRKAIVGLQTGYGKHVTSRYSQHERPGPVSRT